MNRLIYIGVIIGLLIGQVCLFVPLAARAVDTPNVAINELMWMGSSATSSDEWIELRNVTDQSLDLSGWRLTKNTSGQETTMLTIPTGKSIPANGFFLISNFAAESAQSTLNVIPDLVNTAVALVNSDLKIKLYSAGDELIDTADDGDGAPMAGTYTSGSVWQSMERDVNAADGILATSWHTADTSTNFDSGQLEFGTPGAANSDPNTPPTARLNGPDHGTVTEPLNFDGSESFDADGDTLQFNWDFGDGNFSALETPSHAFMTPGTFTVRLTANDGRDQAEVQLAVAIGENTAAPDQPVRPPTPQSYSRLVTLNELLPNPIGDDLAGEFIELFNAGNERIDLAGWRVSDTSKSYTLGVGLAATVIEPNSYLVIPRTVTDIALNNSTSETVRLFAPDETLASEVTYPSPAPEGQSYGQMSSDWQWCPTPTPGAANTAAGSDDSDEDATSSGSPAKTSQPSPSTGDISNQVKLTELLPNPTGPDTEDEFIEITNFDRRPINLLGWQLTDKTTTYTWKKAVVIGSNESLAVYRPETKISLNNSADQLFLVAPNGQIVNGVVYSKAAEGMSWNRSGSTEHWAWSAEATPGESNQIVPPDEDGDDTANAASDVKVSPTATAQTVDVAKLKTLPSRSAVNVQGVITVAPGTFAKRTAYLEDASGGVQLTWPTTFELSLAAGDAVTASGTVSISQDEHRLMIKSADQISVTAHNTAITPTELTQAPSDDQISRLVSLTGSVTAKESSGLVIKGSDQTYAVLFKKSADIDPPDVEVGQMVGVIGLLTKDAHGISILPRTNDDIRLAEVKGASTDQVSPSPTASAGSASHFGIILLGALVIIGGGVAASYYIRHRRGLARHEDAHPH